MQHVYRVERVRGHADILAGRRCFQAEGAARVYCFHHRRHGVNFTPAGGKVWPARAGAQVVVGNRRGRHFDDRLGGGIVAYQTGCRLPHQGNQAGHVWRRHRSAGEEGIRGIPCVYARANGDARGQELRFQIGPARLRVYRVRVVCGSPVGVSGILAVARARGANAAHVAVARRVTHRVQPRRRGIAAVAGIAVGENGIHARGVPAIDHALVPGIVRLAAVTPGVVHHKGALAGVWVSAGQVPGGGHKLGAGQ